MAAKISIRGSISVNDGGSVTVEWTGLDQTVYRSDYQGDVTYIAPYTLYIGSTDQTGASSAGFFYADGTMVSITTDDANGSETILQRAEDVAYNHELWVSRGHSSWSVIPQDYYYCRSFYADAYDMVYNVDSYPVIEVLSKVDIGEYSVCTPPTDVRINGSDLDITTGDSTAILSWSGAGNGNGRIAGYVIQYAETSDVGSGWSDWVNETVVYTDATWGSAVVNLGKEGTYRIFIIWVISAIDGAYNATSPGSSKSVHRVAGSIRYHNGIEWVDCIPYWHDGTGWVECTPYCHDGSGWVSIG